MKSAESEFHSPQLQPSLAIATDLQRVKLLTLDNASKPLHTEAVQRNADTLLRNGLWPNSLIDYDNDNSHRMGVFENGELSGGIYFGVIPESDDKDVEISYWIDKEKQNRRLGRTAVNAAVRHLINDVGYNVEAQVSLHNEASRNLLLALKFKFRDELGTVLYRESPKQSPNQIAASYNLGKRAAYKIDGLHERTASGLTTPSRDPSVAKVRSNLQSIADQAFKNRLG